MAPPAGTDSPAADRSCCGGPRRLSAVEAANDNARWPAITRQVHMTVAAVGSTQAAPALRGPVMRANAAWDLITALRFVRAAPFKNVPTGRYSWLSKV